MKPKAVHALLFICNLLSAFDGGTEKPIDPASYACSSSSAEPSDIDPNHGLRPEFASTFDIGGIQEMAAEAYREEQHAASLHKPNLKSLMSRHGIELPPLHTAHSRITDACKQHPRLEGTIRCLENESRYRRISFPSRLLFTGPSGCGKTELAKSIARRCNMACLFIKGTSVANTYQNSGGAFLDNLFRELRTDSKNKYLVIVDEISRVSRLSKDGRDIQQDHTATAFWLGLDEISDKRNICVIGTDNQDPDELSDQLKTRFSGKIFHFKHADTSTIVNLMKERLNFLPDGDGASSSIAAALHNCSDAFLEDMAHRVSHLSLREARGLIEEAIELAIHDTENPDDTVLEKHVKQIWNQQNLTWWNKVRQNPTVKYCTTPRAISMGTGLAGLGIWLYGKVKDQKECGYSGKALMSLATMYYTWNKDKEEESILPALQTLSHTVERAEAEAQFEQTHELQHASHNLQSEAAQRDIQRIATEAKRYAEQQLQRIEDKAERTEMHLENLRHQYMIQYINGMFSLPDKKDYNPEKQYFDRVREEAMKKLGIDLDQLRDSHNAPTTKVTVKTGETEPGWFGTNDVKIKKDVPVLYT